MKAIKTAFRFIISIIFIWCMINTVRPFWDRYWLELQIEAVTIYGTKNSIDGIKDFLNNAMIEEGYDFLAEDFIIEKDESNNVSITITYIDEISVFGVTLTEIEFRVEATASEVEAY